jgi:hypothetical protein
MSSDSESFRGNCVEVDGGWSQLSPIHSKMVLRNVSKGLTTGNDSDMC